MIYRYLINLLLFISFGFISSAQQLSLAGEWRFAVDRQDKGIEEQWFSKSLEDHIHLPGSMAENRKGDDVTLQTKWTGSIYDSSFFFRPSLAKYRQPGNLKIPFWLTPVKHYVGVAWYQKSINIPANWKGKNVKLFLERCHIQTTAWIDQTEIGRNNSLATPHEFNLPQNINAGPHVLTIRIDNRLDYVNVGPDSHSVTDHTQGNWNGIVGKMLLKATPLLHLEDVQVYPGVNDKLAKVRISVVNEGNSTATGKISINTVIPNTKQPQFLSPVVLACSVKPHDTSILDVSVDLAKNMVLWDEFNPSLYKLTAKLSTGSSHDERVVQFGMRDIKAIGRKIQVNGRPVYLRGDVNNCEFPLTGYAPMDVADWEKLFKTVKAYGFNHMRFHSWCPPEAAFIAADEYGFYLQPEGPTWPNHGTSLGDSRFIDHYLYEETNRMVKAYGNHPSFCMLSGGNEPAGRNQASYLAKFVKYWQVKDPRHLYTGASVAMSWPLYPGSDYMIKSGPRGLNWNSVQPETLSDYSRAVDTFSVPYITHEMGQWCVFPDFKEIKEYTGVNRARNFELFQQDLKDHHMGDEAESFFKASGKLQALCYKEEIEKSLRTKNGAGFQLLGLQDFPGQGTALVGVLNALWEPKEYINAKEWTRFCNSTVPLTRISKFVYTNKENFEAAVEIYHYGKPDLRNALVAWIVKDAAGKIIKQGKFPQVNIITGQNTQIGTISVPLSSIQKATRLNLQVSIENTSYNNDWDFWVYPQTPAMDNKGVYYTDVMDSKAELVLNNGGTVFLNAAGKVVKGKEVVEYFTPVFWNTSWFKMRPPHTTGILVEDKSPAFKFFPTSYHSDLQWWELVNKAQVMHLEDFPPEFRPLVQPIDTWFMNRRLALLMEARVGKGKIIVSSADLFTDTTHRVVARQLLYSLQKYMASPEFNPRFKVDLAVIKDLFISPSREIWESYTKAAPDELRPKK